MNTGATPPSDPLLMLIQRISELQVQQGNVQAQLADDQSEIKLTLATLLTRLEPLPGIAKDLSDLKLRSREHELRLDSKKARLDQLTIVVDALKDGSAKRTGWENFGGKLLYIVGSALAGAVITGFVAIALSGKAKASTDPQFNAAANAKCWAAPAKQPPRWLYL